MSNKSNIYIGNQVLQVEDLGEPMNTHFINLYNSHFFKGIYNLNIFERDSLKFFDKYGNNYDMQDSYFNNFTVIWTNLLSQGLIKKSEEIWNFALDIAHKWEKSNPGKRIHKGTPYYFWGVSCILNNDLDMGFLLIHQALKEDNNSGKTDTPAYSFVTLNYQNQNQFFKSKVDEIARFLDDKLNFYRSKRNMNLTLNEFRLKFLKYNILNEEVFYFVWALFRLKKLLEVDQRLKENVFSSLLEANTILDICLVIDNTIKEKNSTLRDFIRRLNFLSSGSSLSLNLTKLREVNRSYNSNFSTTLENIIKSRYAFSDGSTLTDMEGDLAITYGIRNFGAHSLENQPIIYQNLEEISIRILNTLFLTIEKLY